MHLCRNSIQITRLRAVNRKVICFIITIQAASFVPAAPTTLAVIAQAAAIKPGRLHLYLEQASAGINYKIITRAGSKRDTDD